MYAPTMRSRAAFLVRGDYRSQAAFLKKELLYSMQSIDELFKANQARETGKRFH